VWRADRGGGRFEVVVVKTQRESMMTEAEAELSANQRRAVVSGLDDRDVLQKVVWIANANSVRTRRLCGRCISSNGD